MEELLFSIFHLTLEVIVDVDVVVVVMSKLSIAQLLALNCKFICAAGC
jgi:hypothetical protein